MSSVKIMVLGILDANETAHGYQIYRFIHGWQAETWTNIKPGSIYHALTSLEKSGLIANAGFKTQTGGPAAIAYRINNSGKDELRRLIRQAFLSYDQEDFTASLAWMHTLPRQEVIALARQRLEQYQQTISFMHNLPRDKQPTTPDKHPEIIGSWTALFDATATWMIGFIERLESGQYHFANE